MVLGPCPFVVTPICRSGLIAPRLVGLDVGRSKASLVADPRMGELFCPRKLADQGRAAVEELGHLALVEKGGAHFPAPRRDVGEAVRFAARSIRAASLHGCTRAS